jgi:hypothetical protein
MARKLKELSKKELISLIKNQNKMLRICDDNIQQLNKSGAGMYLKYKSVEHDLNTLRSQKNSETEYFDRNFREEKHSLEVDKMTLKKELADMGVELWDTKEALSRSRQRAKSLQELADRKHWETASIEDMAMNLCTFWRKKVTWTLMDMTKAWAIKDYQKIHIMDWDQYSDDQKDIFRANLTDIISHKR